MRVHSLSPKDWGKAIGVGVLTAILLSLIMVPAAKLGLSPMPKPLSLAFVETLLGGPVPLPLGLLFHVAWVTAFSVVYVMLFRDRLTFMRALWLAAALWLLVLVFYFPFVGWGFFGLGVGPQLIVGAAVPHLLFAIFLWGLCRMFFKDRPGEDAAWHRHAGHSAR